MSKRILLKTIYCAAAFTVTFCFLQHSNARDCPAYGKVIEDNVNIRADSTTGASVLGTADYGEILRISREKYSWFKVNLPRRLSCYVASDFLRKTEGKKAVVTASSLNMRQSPSEQSAIIGKIPGGGKVTVLRKQGQWTEIQAFPYAYGWIHSKFIIPLLDSETAELPAHLKNIPLIPEAKSKPGQSFEIEPVPLPLEIETAKETKSEIRSEPQTAAVQKEEDSRTDKTELAEIFRKKNRPEMPPLAKGLLSRLRHKSFGCPSNYMLKSSTGFILLKIKPSLQVKNLIDQEVEIWGKVKNSSCVYIEVNTIMPR